MTPAFTSSRLVRALVGAAALCVLVAATASAPTRPPRSAERSRPAVTRSQTGRPAIVADHASAGRPGPAPDPSSPTRKPAGAKTLAMEHGPAMRSAAPSTLLVHSSGDAASQAAVADAGGTITRRIAALGVDVVSVDPKDRAAAQRRLASDPRVTSVEPDLVRHASDLPNDVDATAEGQLFTSRLPAAWDVTHGTSGTVIAIVDTGVDLDHPDLAPRLVTGTDVVNNDPDPSDDEGHGTFVAGVAAADSNNSIGVAGSAYDARIMPVKVLDAEGSGSDSDIAAGIVWATDHGADIINLSLGGPGSTGTLASAASYADSHGVVVVAASGNEGSTVPSYPAAYPSVLAVGATDAYGDVTQFSNRGLYLDVVAQGWDVVSTDLAPGATEAYAVGAGTSFSSPVVAGVAALVLAKNPTFTPAQVRSKITSTAIDRGPGGFDVAYGYGLLDAYATVGGRKAASPPPPVVDANEPNGLPNAAHAIGAGSSGTIAPEDDMDWYYTDVDEPGVLTVTVTPPVDDDGSNALSLDAVVQAFDPQLRSIGTTDAGPPGTPEVSVISAAAAGRYSFAVSNLASSRSTGPASAPHPYSVTSVFAPGVVSTPTLGPRFGIAQAVPAPNATNVAASVHPTLTLSGDMAQNSAESSFSLRDLATNSTVAVERHYDVATRVLTATPTSPLLAGHTYYVTEHLDSGTTPNPFEMRFTVAKAATKALKSDFNKDGYDDVAIGAPNEDVGTLSDAGVVHVLYGSANGTTSAGSQMWRQGAAGITGTAEAGDRFGQAVAAGDVNNDGYADLIVGAPGEDIGSIKDAGLIQVILGSSSGLTSTGTKYWSEDTSGVPGTAETGDRFGGALAVGTFDGGSGADVAIGSPGEGIGTAPNAGSLTVLRGGAGGLVTSGSQLWTQGSAGIDFFPESGDGFGSSVAAGDFQGDGNDDLAIGTPSDNVEGTDEGSVVIMRGSIVGLRPEGLLADDMDGATPEAGDLFGSSVAIADVGGYSQADGYADLVIGVPGEDSGAGAAHIVYSDHSDPWIATQGLNTASLGGPSASTGQQFGFALAGRAYGGRGFLTVGVPGVSSNAGAVHVFATFAPAGGSGYFGPNALVDLVQGSTGVSGVAESGDRFGAAVDVADVDGDKKGDLVAGAPGEAVGSVTAAGNANVVRNVLSPARSGSEFDQSTSGIADSPESGDRFGAAVR